MINERLMLINPISLPFTDFGFLTKYKFDEQVHFLEENHF